MSNRTPSPGVYAVDCQAAAERLLVEAAGGNVGTPSWTPDGKDVVYSVTSGGAARLMLGTQELAAERRRVPVPRAVDLADRIPLHRRRQDQAPTVALPPPARPRPASTPTRSHSRATLTVTPANYTRKKRDFNATTAKPVLGIMHPRASRDGKRIAFAALGDLWVMTIAAASPSA